MEKQTYTVPEGCKITSVDLEKGVVVYESEEPKFKSGDFLANDHCITIFKGTEEGYERHFASLRKRDKTLTCFSSDSGWGCVRYFKIATTEEKQLLIDKMHEAGKDWDEEKCEVIDYKSEEPKFKRGDFVYENKWIWIYNETKNKKTHYHFTAAREEKGGFIDISNDGNFYIDVNSPRLATHEEKQLLLDKMHEAGKDWDEEKCDVIDYVWKPKIGEEYWRFWVSFSYIWQDDDIDRRLLEENKIFKTESLKRAAEDKITEFSKEVLKEVKHF